jgi:hypothetical protein
MKKRKVKQILSGGWCQWEGRAKERVKEVNMVEALGIHV